MLFQVAIELILLVSLGLNDELLHEEILLNVVKVLIAHFGVQAVEKGLDSVESYIFLLSV